MSLLWDGASGRKNYNLEHGSQYNERWANLVSLICTFCLPQSVGVQMREDRNSAIAVSLCNFITHNFIDGASYVTPRYF
jgi:hypothetical protein